MSLIISVAMRASTSFPCRLFRLFPRHRVPFSSSSSMIFSPVSALYPIIRLYMDKVNTANSHNLKSFSSSGTLRRSSGRGRGSDFGKGGAIVGEDNRIDALGRLMTRVLRHMAAEVNLEIRSDGYVRVGDLLKLNLTTYAKVPLREHTIEDVKEAVRRDNKQRFSLLEENGMLLIRANQGHSIKNVTSESLLKPILSADEIQVCVHGTYKRNLESILHCGLKRMGRLHVHFASGLPSDGEVISGIHQCILLATSPRPPIIAATVVGRRLCRCPPPLADRCRRPSIVSDKLILYFTLHHFEVILEIEVLY